MIDGESAIEYTMKIILAAIAPTRSRAKSSPADALAADYVARASHFSPCVAENFPSEGALLATLDRAAARTAPHLILLDSRGKQLSSEAFAAHIGGLRDNGIQSLILAIGPADGWSERRAPARASHSPLAPSRCRTPSPAPCSPNRSTAPSPSSLDTPTTPATKLDRCPPPNPLLRPPDADSS